IDFLCDACAQRRAMTPNDQIAENDAIQRKRHAERTVRFYNIRLSERDAWFGAIAAALFNALGMLLELVIVKSNLSVRGRRRRQAVAMARRKGRGSPEGGGRGVVRAGRGFAPYVAPRAGSENVMRFAASKAALSFSGVDCTY